MKIRSSILPLAVAAFFLTGCSLNETVRLCGNTVFQWDAAQRYVLIGALEFYPNSPWTRQISFAENGDWTLRYLQRGGQFLDDDCIRHTIVDKIFVFRYDADDGANGTVFESVEKAWPDFCDANGDGIIPSYTEQEPGWFVMDNPYRLTCERGSWVDSVLAFLGLLLTI